MAAVENLCSRAVLLDKGILLMNDHTDKIIDHYLKEMMPSSIVDTTLADRKDRSGNGAVKFTNFYLEDEKGNRLKAARSGMNLYLVFEFKCSKDTPQKNIDIGFSVHSLNEQLLLVLYSSYLNQIFEQVPYSGKFKCFIPKIPLASGRYRVGGRITVNGEEADWPAKGIGYLDIEAGDFYGTGSKGFEQAPFLINGNWKVTE